MCQCLLLFHKIQLIFSPFATTNTHYNHQTRHLGIKYLFCYCFFLWLLVIIINHLYTNRLISSHIKYRRFILACIVPVQCADNMVNMWNRMCAMRIRRSSMTACLHRVLCWLKRLANVLIESKQNWWIPNCGPSWRFLIQLFYFCLFFLTF